MKNKKITRQQQKALHLFFTLLAKELNDAGFDVRKTLRQDVEIPWTNYMVKEFLWRPVMKAMYGNRSTRYMASNELDKIFDTINRAIGERTGVHMDFPSIESLMEAELKNEANY